MATPETIGIATCGGCGRDADVKLNAGNFVYYHCGCGHSERTHNTSSSRRFQAARMRPVNFAAAPTEPALPDPAGDAKKDDAAPPAEKEKDGFRYY